MDTAVRLFLSSTLLDMTAADCGLSMNQVSPYDHRLPRPAHFGVDIDGTFLPSNAGVLEKNRKALANAMNAGYNVFFCTGRPHMSSMAVLDEDFVHSTGYRGYPGVYHNGAVVYDSSGAVLRMCKFSVPFLVQFCDHVLSHGHDRLVVFCDMTDTYMLSDDSSMMKDILSDIDVYDEPTVVTVAELMHKNITLITVHDKEILTQQPHFENNVDYVLKEGSFGAWDVTPCSSTKAEGLKVLLESYGTSGENCGFIGNGTNDIEAMQLCSLSFAVENADPEVKAHAKYTLDESNNDGAFHTAMQLVYGVPCE